MKKCFDKMYIIKKIMTGPLIFIQRIVLNCNFNALLKDKVQKTFRKFYDLENVKQLRDITKIYLLDFFTWRRGSKFPPIE